MTDEERIREILDNPQQKPGTIGTRDLGHGRLMSTTEYLATIKALLEMIREARIEELHQAFKHIENGQNWNDYIQRAIAQLSTNNKQGE